MTRTANNNLPQPRLNAAVWSFTAAEGDILVGTGWNMDLRNNHPRFAEKLLKAANLARVTGEAKFDTTFDHTDIMARLATAAGL